MPDIHPTAIVDPAATIADSVEIGPYCMVGPNVTLGNDVRLIAFVHISGNTVLGDGCVCFPNVTLGGQAQILGASLEANNNLVIGERNVFRENVTVHGATPDKEHPTRIGNDCLFMVGSHIAHDCQVGDKCVLANLASVGGECHVGNQVWFGGGSIIHQKTWIGDHAFVGGGSILVGDAVPFASTQGNHAEIAAVNVVGLKRRGFSKSDLKDIYAVYKSLEHGDGTFKDRVAAAEERFAGSGPAMQVINFVKHPRGGRALCRFRSGK
jgi:UDP-N-acetylglucosamine acyltransferase